MKILGIDEAGRGALIGPLVIGFVILDKPLSFKVYDSKQLTPKQRLVLMDKIEKEAIKVDHIKIEPWEIDKANINNLEYDKIKKYLEGIEVDAVYIDAFMDPAKLKKLHRYVIADYKADMKYPVVSAASIVAKVNRDRYIEELKSQYGDFGSGYPSDPNTIKFISDKDNVKKILKYIRKKWSTYKNLRFLNSNDIY